MEQKHPQRFEFGSQVIGQQSSRRVFLRRAAALGFSAPALTLMLAACGGDDEAEPTATAGQTAAQPTQAAAPTSPAATAPAATAPATAVSTTAASSQAVPDATLTLALSVDISNLDPPIYNGSIDLLVDNLIYDTLIDQDVNTGELLPRLAQSWETVDNTTLRFKLRSGVTFSDGTAVNADVVKKSFDRARQEVKGSTFFGEIAQITVLDPTSVEFKLARPYAPLMPNLAHPAGGVESPKIVDKDSVDGVADVIGTGPFKLVTWTPQQELVLERSTSYWGEKPKLAKVVLKIVTDETTRLLALRSGEVDGILNPPVTEISNLRKDSNLTVWLGPQARLVWIGFNFQNELLGSNLKLRQAVAHAIDAKSIVELALEGIPRLADAGPIPPEILPTNPPLKFAYNPTQAKQLLTEAGYPNGIDLDLWTPNGRYFGDRAIAEVAQQQLAQVGIRAELKVLEWGALQDAYANHQQQMFVLGWGYHGSAASALDRIFMSDANTNWSGYQNPTMDEMLKKASEIFDYDQQVKAYYEISKLLMDDVVVVPIYYAVNVWATTNKVKDLVISPEEIIFLNTTWITK